MNTAEQAEYKLKDNSLLGCTWAKDVDYSFEWLLNEYISEVVSVDISRKVIDFKDGSVIIFKEGTTWYYTETQGSRG